MVAIHFEKEKNIASVEFEIERNHLKKMILLDELTGIANRKALVEMNFVFYFEILISKKLKIFVSKYK